jgi:hypothetical protein
MKLKDLLKEEETQNPNYAEKKYTAKFDDAVLDLDDILDDSNYFYSRKEFDKFLDDSVSYSNSTFNKKNIKADDLKNDIDAIVKFYENAINNKVKKSLDLMKKEANLLKSKIK